MLSLFSLIAGWYAFCTEASGQNKNMISSLRFDRELKNWFLSLFLKLGLNAFNLKAVPHCTSAKNVLHALGALVRQLMFLMHGPARTFFSVVYENNWVIGRNIVVIDECGEEQELLQVRKTNIFLLLCCVVLWARRKLFVLVECGTSVTLSPHYLYLFIYSVSDLDGEWNLISENLYPNKIFCWILWISVIICI